MLRSFRLFILLSLLRLLFGCDDHPTDVGQANVSVAISALTAADVASVHVTVSAPDITAPITASLIKVGATWQGTIPNIPAGVDRVFSADAMDAANTLIFSGNADGVTIIAGNTAVVMIVLQEATPPGPFGNSSPYITSFFLSSDRVAPSTTVIFGAEAIDPDDDPLTYQWTSTGGAFSAPTLTDTSWLAPAADGDYPITFTVTDPHAASDSLSATVHVETPTLGTAGVLVTFNLFPRIANVTSTLSRLQDGGPATMLSADVSDADGDALSYAWSADCLGTFGTSFPASSPATTFVMTDPTATGCALTITALDARGAESSGTIHIVVGPPPSPNRAPQIVSALQSAEVTAHDEEVTFHIEATDPDGDPIMFVWEASAGTLATSTDTSGSSEVIWTAPSCFNTSATIKGHAIDGTWDTTVEFTVVNQNATCSSRFDDDINRKRSGELAIVPIFTTNVDRHMGTRS